MKNELSQIISQSRSLVFFGGAGVSTESGIPDFRSVDGLYNQKYDYPPEQMLSHTFFERKTEDFYRFYRDKILSYAVSAKPNAAHRKLAELEEKGILSAVVTQNIDGLHQAAGLVNYFNGKHLVVINMSPTSADSRADLLICGKVGEVLGGIDI